MIVPILSVKDVDASIAFYTEKLGFALDMTMPDPTGKTFFAFVRQGQKDNPIGLSLDAELEHRGQGVELMIYVPDEVDLDGLYSSIRGKNVAIAEEIGDRYWGDRTFTLHDPDGYKLTFARTVKEMSFEEIQATLANSGGAS